MLLLTFFGRCFVTEKLFFFALTRLAFREAGGITCLYKYMYVYVPLFERNVRCQIPLWTENSQLMCLINALWLFFFFTNVLLTRSLNFPPLSHLWLHNDSFFGFLYLIIIIIIFFFYVATKSHAVRSVHFLWWCLGVPVFAHRASPAFQVALSLNEQCLCLRAKLTRFIFFFLSFSDRDEKPWSYGDLYA